MFAMDAEFHVNPGPTSCFVSSCFNLSCASSHRRGHVKGRSCVC